MLCSRLSLVFCLTHISVFMSVPISQSIPLPFSHLGVHTLVLYICVSISALQKELTLDVWQKQRLPFYDTRWELNLSFPHLWNGNSELSEWPAVLVIICLALNKCFANDHCSYCCYYYYSHCWWLEKQVESQLLHSASWNGYFGWRKRGPKVEPQRGSNLDSERLGLGVDWPLP